MPQGQALSPLVTEQIKHSVANGTTHQNIANQFGISKRSSLRVAKTYKKDIEQLALDIVNESIPIIRANHINTLKLSQKLIESVNKKPNTELNLINSNMAAMGLTAKDIITIADKKEFRALQVMGIAPSTTPSIIINQLLNVNISEVVDPNVQAALGGHLAGILSDDNVTDADYTEDMSNTEGED